MLLRSAGVPLEGSCNRLWRDSLTLLQEFITEFGRLPRVRDTYKGRNLGKWACRQRTAFRRGILSAEQEELLRETGMIFN